MSHGEWDFWSALCVTCHILPSLFDPRGHCGSHVVTLSKRSTRRWLDSHIYLLGCIFIAFEERGGGNKCLHRFSLWQLVLEGYIRCCVWSVFIPFMISFLCSHCQSAPVFLPYFSLSLWRSFRPLIFPPTAYWESCYRPPMKTLSLSKLLNTDPPSHDNIGSSSPCVCVCVVSFHFHKTK